MTELGTWDQYKQWDADRRAAWPNARHWIYASWLTVAGDTLGAKLAEFCPLTGWSRIDLPQ